MTTPNAEIREGTRFVFGKNWSRFLSVLDEDRGREAERSLARMVGGSDLKDINFLDVGSGSGLFSIAVRRLGARVHSFDFDPQSVASPENSSDGPFSSPPHAKSRKDLCWTRTI